MKDCLKVVVTGEVDSGKSTLIGRFLYDTGSVSEGTMGEIKNVLQGLGRNVEFAYLLDSFEEERRNQLTIDTTQIFCKNRKGKDFLFIDVPGHRQLLKNMLSGSSYADMAILVVDIRKSIEEGTKRHANVLKFLGIEQIIVALNKIDLINLDENAFRQAEEKIAGFSKNIDIKPKYIIPVSAKQGENFLKKSSRMPWYKGISLIEALNTLNKGFKKDKGCDFYFPIQDIYNIDKEIIYVGNIISGKIRKGETVRISPLNKESRVREIKAFNKVKPWAKAPESIGLVLTESENLQRGQIIYKGGPREAVTKILAKIFCVYPLNIDERIVLKCSTQETYAKIKQINKVFNTDGLKIIQGLNNLKEADAAEVVIATESPILITKFQQLDTLGRFILQDNRGICAAGITL